MASAGLRITGIELLMLSEVYFRGYGTIEEARVMMIVVLTCANTNPKQGEDGMSWKKIENEKDVEIARGLERFLSSPPRLGIYCE